jgi:hypothetical protein
MVLRGLVAVVSRPMVVVHPADGGLPCDNGGSFRRALAASRARLAAVGRGGGTVADWHVIGWEGRWTSEAGHRSWSWLGSLGKKVGNDRGLVSVGSSEDKEECGGSWGGGGLSWSVRLMMHHRRCAGGRGSLRGVGMAPTVVQRSDGLLTVRSGQTGKESFPHSLR